MSKNITVYIGHMMIKELKENGVVLLTWRHINRTLEERSLKY